mgnify:CR=1 FL=1
MRISGSRKTSLARWEKSGLCKRTNRFFGVISVKFCFEVTKIGTCRVYSTGAQRGIFGVNLAGQVVSLGYRGGLGAVAYVCVCLCDWQFRKERCAEVFVAGGDPTITGESL